MKRFISYIKNYRFALDVQSDLERSIRYSLYAFSNIKLSLIWGKSDLIAQCCFEYKSEVYVLSYSTKTKEYFLRSETFEYVFQYFSPREKDRAFKEMMEA